MLAKVNPYDFFRKEYYSFLFDDWCITYTSVIKTSNITSHICKLVYIELDDTLGKYFAQLCR